MDTKNPKMRTIPERDLFELKAYIVTTREVAGLVLKLKQMDLLDQANQVINWQYLRDYGASILGIETDEELADEKASAESKRRA